MKITFELTIDELDALNKVDFGESTKVEVKLTDVDSNKEMDSNREAVIRKIDECLNPLMKFLN